jgi:type IV secretion system protein VirD4
VRADRGVNAGSHRADLLLAAIVALGVGVGLVVWLTGEIAALLAHGRWPAVSPAAALSILAEMPGTFGHPANAWPAGVRNQLPTSAWWFVAAAAITLSAAAGLVAAGLSLTRLAHAGPRPGASGPVVRRPRPRPRGRIPAPSPRASPGAIAPSGAYWAARRDVTSLRVRRPGGDRIVLGRVGRSLVATEARHSVLVLGPTQSGKTTALAIPALLEWGGPVLATSVKDDLISHTRGYRATLGVTWLYDPTGAVTSAPRSQWSPLAEASTWSGAQRVAQVLVDAAPTAGGLTDGAFWYRASAKLLAPLLLAAQLGGRPMADVVRWTNLQETEEVRWLLELAGETDAVSSLDAARVRDERISSSVYTTLETVLAPFEDPIVAQSAAASEIDPARFLAGSNTLYLCGPSHEQARVQAVFSALVAAVVHAAVSRYERRGPLDPPLLVLLDEAANIAPFPDLDTLASTAAGMGIQVMTICQDLAQLANRYGAERARTIANNHRAKVALSGIADVGTLDTLSGLAGEGAVSEQTVTTDLRDGRRSTSTSVAYRRLAPPDELRRIRPGEGLLIYGHLPPARLVLRPWYRDRPLRRRVDGDRPPRESVPAPRQPSG